MRILFSPVHVTRTHPAKAWPLLPKNISNITPELRKSPVCSVIHADQTESLTLETVRICYCCVHSSLSGFSSTSRMPFLINSSGAGLPCKFFSKLSARMCRSSSFWWPWIAGAAFESGRMFPICG